MAKNKKETLTVKDNFYVSIFRKHQNTSKTNAMQLLSTSNSIPMIYALM